MGDKLCDSNTVSHSTGPPSHDWVDIIVSTLQKKKVRLVKVI